MASTLFYGGHVVTLDPARGDLPSGDVLIDGAVITEIGLWVDAVDAVAIDVSGMIVILGFRPVHRHLWQHVPGAEASGATPAPGARADLIILDVPARGCRDVAALIEGSTPADVHTVLIAGRPARP
ncbi:hypothetical protein Aph02nite_77090 [Actinoplanes philippinensis]|uniref:Uncharacterized protein n=1 Tax=Actinoplanes philippinensis TaxID=35752 RepID=A0A1I2HEF1_9ACTN|nr:hypothetical protein [Actinoplanes philippinensis]GIE81759.1 hypothetical protein Aph02nite_77090 [Actinoplanes philippinensis]SFF28554.1 hypothetical protein SAMN05421541_108148 [Actinoplanes philippinensis]